MGCILCCFRHKDKQEFPPPVSPKVIVDSAPTRIAKVSQNQLSDLFKSQEIEDFYCHGKTIPPEIVDIQSNHEKMCMEDESGKQLVQPSTPAKLYILEKGFDSLEETPTSCISDPPTAGGTSISAAEKGNQRCYLPKHDNRLTSLQEDLNVHGNLTSWLKPVQHTNVGNKVIFQDEFSHKKTAGDRPILGTVATYWNEEVELPAIQLKWWDGNGIPNSTNKYREDQKVSWHVTPFEERLEKALSEEKSISQSRKHISGSRMAFEDGIDKASSQLQSLAHPKSAVSF